MSAHHCNVQGGQEKGTFSGHWQSLTMAVIQPYNLSCDKNILSVFRPPRFTFIVKGHGLN